MISTRAFLSLSAALASSVAADLGKSLFYPQGLGSALFMPDKLPRSPITSQSDIGVPQECIDYGAKTNGDGSRYCPSGNFNAREVTFEGCNLPFRFCACQDDAGSRTVTIDEIVTQFSGLPWALKQNIRYYISFPADSTWAQCWQGPNDINIFGRGEDDGTPGVGIHESGHALDAAGGETGKQEWKDAIGGDSCVPDAYANSNEVEDFAQVTWVALWRATHDGSLPDPNNPSAPADATCMARQLAYFDNSPRLNAQALTVQQCDEGIKGNYGYRTAGKAKRITFGPWR